MLVQKYKDMLSGKSVIRELSEFATARGKEIGVHALRGGTEAGEHSVFFFGDNERITVSHHAANRQIFVNGAIRAAQYLEGREAGMYNMDDLLLMGGKE